VKAKFSAIVKNAKLPWLI